MSAFPGMCLDKGKSYTGISISIGTSINISINTSINIGTSTKY